MACPRVSQGPVLSERIDHVSYTGRRRRAHGGRSTRPDAGHRTLGDGGRRGRGVHRGGAAMTSVAFHVDQLFSQVSGGIGTYTRALIPAMADQDPGLEVTLFHARFPDAMPERWMRRFWVEELHSGIRFLYPRWNLTARPMLPPAVSSLDVLHAPSPASVPPAGPRQRLAVTVHVLSLLATAQFV